MDIYLLLQIKDFLTNGGGFGLLTTAISVVIYMLYRTLKKLTLCECQVTELQKQIIDTQADIKVLSNYMDNVDNLIKRYFMIKDKKGEF